LCWSPAVRAAQQQRERVPLLAGQRGRLSGQPGDVGIQAGVAVACGVPVVVVVLVVLAAAGGGRGAGRAWLAAGWQFGCLPGSSSPVRLLAAMLVPWHA
jgi:hypothetical protein